jgi:hypothetical protein
MADVYNAIAAGADRASRRGCYPFAWGRIPQACPATTVFTPAQSAYAWPDMGNPSSLVNPDVLVS